MSTVRVKCTGAQVLYYEPGGLLLSTSLLPVDEWHGQHLLTFQLSYLGAGDLAIQVAIEAIQVAIEDDASPEPILDVATGPPFAAATLRGGHKDAVQPGAWLSSMLIPDSRVDYRLTVRSGPVVDGTGLTGGMLVARIAGYVPLLNADIRAGVTQPLPVALPAVLSGVA